MRHALFSRTNVNPARMFSDGLTPTIHPSYLRDRQSRTDTAWSKRILLQNLSEIWPVFEEKTVKNYHKINHFTTTSDTRPMTSLRHSFWRFSPFWTQESYSCFSKTSDSSLIEEKWSGNRSITWSYFDQEIDHNFSRIDSRETLKVKSIISKIEFSHFSDFRVA